MSQRLIVSPAVFDALRAANLLQPINPDFAAKGERNYYGADTIDDLVSVILVPGEEIRT